MISERRAVPRCGRSCLVACLLLCLSVPCAAASQAGKVVFAFGDVSATAADGSRRALARGDAIAAGDTVITGRGRAQIRLTDGGFVALNPETEYALEDYAFDDAAPASGRSFFNLVRGGVRMVTGAIARANRSNWRMRTAVATIGIRGSGGYFRYVSPPGSPEPSLAVNVDFGGFTATDPFGNLVELGPGVNYLCAPTCAPVDGAGPQEDLTFVEIPEEERFLSGERLFADDNIIELDNSPILPGEAPDGTHISVAWSITEPFFSPPPTLILNSFADGATTDGVDNLAEFGSLLMFEWFTGFPCEPCVFLANDAEHIVDAAPDGSTFNTELQAEWGRVTGGYTVSDLGTHTPVGQFHWVASTDPTPDAELPTSGLLIYDNDVGGTLATHTYGTAGKTEVATARSQVRIAIDYGNGGAVDDFRITGGFPSGTTYVLQSADPSGATIQDGFISFDGALSSITVPVGSAPALETSSTMCSGGCTFFGTSVFGAAGADAIGITGSFQGNTSQPSYPAHSVTGTFVLER